MEKDASAKSTSKRKPWVRLIIVAVLAFSVWYAVVGLLPFVLGTNLVFPRSKSPFLEAHQRAITTFVDSAGFGGARLRESKYWFDFSLILEGLEYQARDIQLLGLTSEYGDRYYTGLQPKKNKLANATHRPLTTEEKEAVTRLRAGEAWVKLAVPPNPAEDTSEHIRVIAPIFAQASCLECHEVKTGALLGAFDYHLRHFPPREPTPASKKADL